MEHNNAEIRKDTKWDIIARIHQVNANLTRVVSENHKVALTE